MTVSLLKKAPAAPARRRSFERAEFLSDLIVTAVEHMGTGFIGADEYEIDDDDPNRSYAVVYDRYEMAENGDDGQRWRLDMDTMSHAIGLIRSARPGVFPVGRMRVSLVKGVPNTQPMESALANVETGERLGLSEHNRRRILAASRENDGGELDVEDALAIAEIACFGYAVYT